MNTKILQWILAILILGTAVKIWLDVFFKLEYVQKKNL